MLDRALNTPLYRERNVIIAKNEVTEKIPTTKNIKYNSKLKL